MSKSKCQLNDKSPNAKLVLMWTLKFDINEIPRANKTRDPRAFQFYNGKARYVYSTVTLLARFLGWSTSVPLKSAI